MEYNNYIKIFLDKIILKKNTDKKWIEYYKKYYDLLELIDSKELGDDVKYELQILVSEIKEDARKLFNIYAEKEFFMELQSGTGGEDAQDWTEILFKMYTKYLEQKNIKWELINYQKLSAGIRNATIKIKAPILDFLNEVGIHRLVRISPFNAKGKRQTSFASVYLYPIIEEKLIRINDSDLKIETFRSSGAGGQHVNTTDSAVRLTHLTTGLTVSCQQERSQKQNLDVAKKILYGKLIMLQREEINQKQQNISQKQSISWSSQFRSYTLDPQKILKDSRCNIEIKSDVYVERVLAGELDIFINPGPWVIFTNKTDDL